MRCVDLVYNRKYPVGVGHTSRARAGRPRRASRGDDDIKDVEVDGGGMRKCSRGSELPSWSINQPS
jgi:hypothetical protein